MVLTVVGELLLASGGCLLCGLVDFVGHLVVLETVWGLLERLGSFVVFLKTYLTGLVIFSLQIKLPT